MKSATLVIAGLNFKEAKSLAPHGAPLARFTQRESGPVLAFNRAQIEALPELAKARRVKVFFGDATKPTIALFPAEEGQGVSLLPDGADGFRRKIKGACLLEKLAAYDAVEFRVEQIDKPSLGWLLTATASERKA